MRQLFADRAEAGRRLAGALASHRAAAATTVLGLPRGGVPVAYEIAQALDLPLDVLVVRKLGLPWQSELAMGANASGGALVVNEDVVRHLGGRGEAFEAVRAREQAELARREREYRGDRPALDMRGRTGILVDDTWFFYACYLHSRLMRGWKGRKVAAVAVLGFVAVIFTYLGVNLLLSGLHSYGSQ